MICRVLEVSRSGYYDWLHRRASAPGPRAAQAAVLVTAIKEIHAKFRYYGSPRSTTSCSPVTTGWAGIGRRG